MTDVATMTSSRDVRTNLLRTWTGLKNLAHAATIVENNYLWLLVNHGQMIPFLDADVVYGSILGSAATNLTLDALEGPEAITFDFRRLVGPHFVRHYLKSSGRLSLPAGTVAELLRKQRHTAGELSAHANTFLKLLDEARNNVDITGRALAIGSDEGVVDVLRKSLLAFRTNLDDGYLLEEILGNHVPPESLAEQVVDDDANQTFDSMMRVLEKSRPRASQNNYHDALNAATVVRVFNNGIETSDGRSVPVLISGTSEVLTNSELLKSHLKTRSILTPTVLTDRAFLMLFAALSDQTDGRRYQVAADLARQIREHCDDLCNWYTRLSQHTELYDDAGGHIFQRPEIENDVLMLQMKTDTFIKRWRSILWPAQRADSFDRMAWINALFSPEISRTLNSRNKNEVRIATDKLRGELRNQKVFGDDQEIWDLLQQHRFISMTSPDVSNYSPAAVFFTQVPNDGTPLHEVKPGIAFIDFCADDRAREHDIRIAAHHPFSNHGTFLAVDSWRTAEAAARVVGIVWLHLRDAEIMVTELLRLGRSVAKVTGHKLHRITARMFSLTEQCDVELESESSLEVEILRSAIQQVGYFEIYIGDITLFADVQPLEGQEFQAGLCIRDDVWNSAAVALVAETISRTSDFLNLELNSRILVDILRRVAIP